MFFASISCYLWYSGEQEKINGPIKAAKKEEEDAKYEKIANEKLWFNRFGVPVRPTRSIDDFMVLITSESALDKVFKYIDCPTTVSIYEDYQKGLDAAASDEDKKIMEYYQESLKHKADH